MRWTIEELKQRVMAIPDNVRMAIICDLARDMFGDMDDTGVEYVDLDHEPDRSDLKKAARHLNGDLFVERAPLTVKEVIRSGELEIEPGHTMAEITEMASECLNATSSWDICGEVMFLGSDDRYYVATVEFVIAPGNPAYVKDVLKGDADDEEETE